MSKCIGGITHEAVSSLATHKPSKSFGNLFEENKAQLESLQAGLARAVLPKTPPIPTVKYCYFGIISIPEFGLSNSPFSFDDFNIRRGPFGQETLCRHGYHEIHGKPSDASVARVFYLNDVLQFVFYRLNQCPFPQ